MSNKLENRTDYLYEQYINIRMNNILHEQNAVKSIIDMAKKCGNDHISWTNKLQELNAEYRELNKRCNMLEKNKKEKERE